MLGRIRAGRGAGEQVWFVPNTVGGCGDTAQPEKRFTTSTLSFTCTYSDRKLLYKYEDFFFCKTGNFIINWVPSLLFKHATPERLSSQSDKI